MSTSVYCDESCHLENDESNVMGLGSIICEKSSVRRLSVELRKIKDDFQLRGEIKWTKVSPKNLHFYCYLVDWLFHQKDIRFRSLIVPDKSIIDNVTFNDGDHNNFYYKMYYTLLSRILDRDNTFEIYLDIKDTCSGEKIKELKKVLHNKMWDFNEQTVKNIQHVRSHEVELLQICDLLLGTVVYANRGLQTSTAKVALVKHVEKHLHRSITKTTYGKNLKFDVFVWKSSKNG